MEEQWHLRAIVVFDSHKERRAQKKELLSWNLIGCRKFVAQSTWALSSILIAPERVKTFWTCKWSAFCASRKRPYLVFFSSFIFKKWYYFVFKYSLTRKLQKIIWKILIPPFPPYRLSRSSKNINVTLTFQHKTEAYSRENKFNRFMQLL